VSMCRQGWAVNIASENASRRARLGAACQKRRRSVPSMYEEGIAEKVVEELELEAA